MDRFLVINGEKLTLDFPILEYLVLNCSKLSINVTKKRQQTMFSVVVILMDLLVEFLMQNLMQLMFSVVLVH